MKYLETKHEKNSAKITALIILILMLLIFVVGPQYMDPPEEYGVAVNFGTNDFGSGNTPLSKPKQADIPSKPQEENTKQETTVPQKSEPKTEDVLTQETEEALAIKKKREAEAKAKADAERAERLKREAEERKKREEAEKRKKLDNLIGGVKNSKGNDTDGEGPDNSPGNKGQLDGNPYAPSYFGGPGPGKGGVGYGLSGRGRPSKKIFKQDCNEYGLVIVRIEVDRSGRVTSATPGAKGSTNTHPCLLEPAKKIALSHKWPADANAPAKQIGFVSINFDVSQ
ncbi:outer membrane transport energization protein TonB [Winogradskyella wandonensis]|uniref:Outer membrane transport energization protein TonB n=1 Tax=Winogradskyella wandonensis TaxID=1442586 RepID=A0A4R1KTL2_9FLAO|nr:energy transducer TonB [Winogradskyella wandonensis]TCK68502.1 outer membrane transport energization protein TonB [Winogradskyella wandonensis]